MTDLENRLRESFDHQTSTAPGLDLADRAVRSGRRARRRRTALTAAVPVLLLSLGGVVIALPHDGEKTQLYGGAPVRSVAPVTDVVSPEWADALGVDRAGPQVPVVVGSAVVVPGRTDPVDVQDVVYAVSRAGDRAVVSTQDGRLLSIGRTGEPRVLRTGTGQGHAVSPDGTQVAVGTRQGLVLLDVATGAVRRQLREDTPVPDRPRAWTGGKVLVDAGDGGGGRAELWDPVAGTSRTLGEPGTYWGAYDAADDLVALGQGDGGCVAVSYLARAGDLWTDCNRRDAEFSPDGTRVLVGAPGEVPNVRDAVTGDTVGQPRFPDDGLLAWSWADDDSLLLVVRVLQGDGSVAGELVRCPVGGSACVRVQQLPEGQTALIASAR